nr:cuticle protein 19.8-like [Penaeus vannamei]
MISKVICDLELLWTKILVSNNPTYGYTPEPTYEEPAKYDFNYAVKDDYSGNDFGHQEARDGYNTQGSYYVLLPDGRLQKVTYTVNGDSGYVAEVSYEGEAQHSEYKPAPTYKPAPATSPPCLQAYSCLQACSRLRTCPYLQACSCLQACSRLRTCPCLQACSRLRTCPCLQANPSLRLIHFMSAIIYFHQ